MLLFMIEFVSDSDSFQLKQNKI